MRTFVLTVGAPGSGKTEWARSFVKETTYDYGVKCAYISRDEIRSEVLGNENGYFIREDKVLDKFFETLKEYIRDPDFKEIVVDGTNLNPSSRSKILSLCDDSITTRIAAVFIPPLSYCLERNEQKSLSMQLPGEIVESMYNSLVMPTEEESFDYVWIIRSEDEWKEM